MIWQTLFCSGLYNWLSNLDKILGLDQLYKLLFEAATQWWCQKAVTGWLQCWSRSALWSMSCLAWSLPASNLPAMCISTFDRFSSEDVVFRGLKTRGCFLPVPWRPVHNLWQDPSSDLQGKITKRFFSTRNVSVSFRLDLIHTSPCYTWVGSAHRIANSAKPRNLSGSAPCSRTLTTLWFESDGTFSQTAGTPVFFVSQVSALLCCHCVIDLMVMSLWELFAFTCEMTLRCLFSLALDPIRALVPFFCLFILSRVSLPWIATLLASPSQKPVKGRQSNPAQETSQPVFAGSQRGSRVLIFIHQTPRTT